MKSIQSLAGQLDRGELTAVELSSYYLERIESIDRQGPQINAIIEINPDCLEIAAGLDRERAAGKVRGPLHGIPIVLKDNIDTADRMMTTAGSLALHGSFAKQDAFLAAQLRRAGAIILGKTNLSEWANFRSTHSISGWSSRGGQTLNPYALDRNPCGSSSGSAAAVAAELCAAAVGTETDGSIICPSQTNGVVGIKPTLGLVSRDGIIPIAHSQDTAGPIAACVADAAILLGAMTGVDMRDPVTQQSQNKAQSDYTSALAAGDLQGMRLGVARQYFEKHPGVDRVMESCLEVLSGLGAVLVDPVEIKTASDLSEHEIEVLLYEFKADLNAYLTGLGPDAPVHSLEEVIAFNKANQEKVMPYFGQERMTAAQEKGPLSDEPYLKALEACRRLAREEGLDAVLEEHKLQAVLAPSGHPAWLIDPVNGDRGSGGCSSPAAVAGYPHITVPAGYVHGLPVGISFMGSAYTEPVLIRLAYAFEQANQVRQVPQFLATIRF
jgi:amidase